MPHATYTGERKTMGQSGVIMVTCSYCKGRKVAEQFQERFEDEWHGERGSLDLPEPYRTEIREVALQRRPDAFRWATVACPRCQGDGEYLVEGFACKIF